MVKLLEMPDAYRRWMHAREAELCARATDRVVRPFEWGMEWTAAWPCSERMMVRRRRLVISAAAVIRRRRAWEIARRR